MTLITFSSFLTLAQAHDCKTKFSDKELIAQWKAEMTKNVRIYGRFSEWTIENFTKSGQKGSVELHKLKRECKKFEYTLSQNLQCQGRVNLIAITNCQREP